MKLLLDTHVWIWSQQSPKQLGRRTARALVDDASTNVVCTVSTLELARLASTGVITLTVALQDWVEQSLAALAAESLPVTHEIAIEAYALPGAFHKDPADRLLVAAARREGLTLVTADERILAYSAVETLDARR